MKWQTRQPTRGVDLAWRFSLEALETRHLLSAVVVALPVSQYVYDDPFPHGATLAEIGGLEPGVNYTQLHATVQWDDGTPEFEASVYPEGNGIYDVNVFSSLGAPLPSAPGPHTARVHFWETSANGDQVDQLDFVGSAVCDQNSPNGMTIHTVAGQEFSGMIGTTSGVPESYLAPAQLAPVQLAFSSSTAIAGASSTANDAASSLGGTLLPLQVSESSMPPENVYFSVYWGDGTGGGVTFTDNGDGTFSVIGQHTYAQPGTYRIELWRTITFNSVPGEVSCCIAAAFHMDLQSTAVVSGDEGDAKTNNPEPPPPAQSPGPALPAKVSLAPRLSPERNGGTTTMTPTYASPPSDWLSSTAVQSDMESLNSQAIGAAPGVFSSLSRPEETIPPAIKVDYTNLWQPLFQSVDPPSLSRDLLKIGADFEADVLMLI